MLDEFTAKEKTVVEVSVDVVTARDSATASIAKFPSVLTTNVFGVLVKSGCLPINVTESANYNFSIRSEQFAQNMIKIFDSHFKESMTVKSLRIINMKDYFLFVMMLAY